MHLDRVAQVASPLYGLWRAGADLRELRLRKNALYGCQRGDATGQRQDLATSETLTGAGLFFYLVLFIVAIVLPAVQAFSCGTSTTNLYLPGWAWGVLIILFWPLGLLWLVLSGGCLPVGHVNSRTSTDCVASAAQSLASLRASTARGRVGCVAAVILSPLDTPYSAFA